MLSGRSWASLLSLFTSADDLLRQEAPIHDEGDAGGEFCVVGTEIENRRGDFLGGAYPPDRDKRGEGIEHLGFLSGKAIEHLGCDGAWGDGVDADVLFGELERNGLAEAFDRVLGCDVDADLAHTTVPGNAGGV